MASITFPTASPVTLNSGEEYTTVIADKSDYILTFTLDRGTGSLLIQNSATLVNGTDVFNRPLLLKQLDSASGPNIKATATLAEAVITLSVVKAPASEYGTVSCTPGVKHQVSLSVDSAEPETSSAVIYFGDSLDAAVSSVYVHDGDIIIPPEDNAVVPLNRGILLTPLVEQTKAQA